MIYCNTDIKNVFITISGGYTYDIREVAEAELSA
jgi:hypothetical protein